MSKIDEQLERMISMAIDGELSDDEQLQLDRELMRNPAARRLMETYQANEAAAGLALAAVLEPGPRAKVDFAAQRQNSGPRIDWSVIVGSPLSAAAALLLAVGVWLVVEAVVSPAPYKPISHAASTGSVGKVKVVTADAVVSDTRLGSPDTSWPGVGSTVVAGHLADVAERPLMANPTSGERRVSKQFMGVYDEPQDTFFFLEMEREEAMMQADDCEL
jgi:hypothetical protein